MHKNEKSDNFLIKRAIHFDFHTLPGIHDFNREWDAVKFAQRLSDAHVKYINMTAQCNIGFSYYQTKIGKPYPGMKGDMFGDALRECHKRGIGVTAYVNSGINHNFAIEHTEWLRLDKEGRVLRGDRGGNFFRAMCFNSPGYKAHLLGVISELKSNYPIDGVFIDCIFASPCYCPHCTDGMLAEGIDLEDDMACYEFSHRKVMEISRDIRNIIGTDNLLIINGVAYYETKDVQRHIEIECIPTDSGWGYDAFPRLAAYARNLKETVVYMTGRFQTSWGDLGGYKSATALENDMFDAVLNGCQLSVGDHMHPAGIMDKDIYRDIAMLYERFMRYEKWTDSARYLPEIGVLTEVKRTPHLSEACSGLARMLGELKYNFDILDVLDQKQDYSRFAMIVLPDIVRLTPELAQKLQKYLDGGGKVLSTGFSALTPDDSRFALSGWKIDFDGKDPSDASYYTFRNVPEGTADIRWSMYCEGIAMTGQAEAEVLADYWKPYFNRGWDGRYGYFYAPPDSKNGQHAAVISGNIAHICFKIFEAYDKHAMCAHKQLIEQILQRFIPQKLIRTSLPSTARVTATGNKDYTLLHCKVTYPEIRGKIGIVEEHVVQSAGAVVSLCGEYKSVCILPSEQPIRAELQGGYTTVTLPEFTGFLMLKFDK